MMPSRFLPSLFASMAVAGLLTACQLPEPRTDLPPFGSQAQITSISPDATQVLHSGEKVKLRVDVSYVLNAESGTIKLIVLAADNSDLAQGATVITRGSGKSTLEAEFTVPGTTTVRVFTPLVVQGQDSASGVDGRAFVVLPN
jgi:hypothetical protein